MDRREDAHRRRNVSTEAHPNTAGATGVGPTATVVTPAATAATFPSFIAR